MFQQNHNLFVRLKEIKSSGKLCGSFADKMGPKDKSEIVMIRKWALWTRAVEGIFEWMHSLSESAGAPLTALSHLASEIFTCFHNICQEKTSADRQTDALCRLIEVLTEVGPSRTRWRALTTLSCPVESVPTVQKGPCILFACLAF